MSRKRDKNKNQGKSDLLKGLASLSLEDIVGLQKTLPTLLQSKLQQMSRSDDLENLLKANLYLDNVNQRQDNVKAVFFNPDEASDTGRGYKDPMFYGSLPFEVLRRMGDIFVVRAVVNTRVEQVQNFLHFSTDEQKEGYTIRRKRNPFEKQSTEHSREDQIKIAYIRKFLEEGGFHDKWESFDTFQDFGRKVVFDSLTLDQLAFEIVRDRSWNLARYRAVDASLIRFLDSIDPKFRDEFEKYRFKGYLPKYCMAWQGQIMENPVTHESVIFYPWELGIGIRNKSTNIYKNGYGTSELETLSSIMTWILWGFEYNGNYFCLSSDTQIVTDSGICYIKDLIGKKFKTFDGVKWTESKAFKTKVDDLYITMLFNGLKIKTSKDHRFLTIADNDLHPVWKRQEELTEEDYCLLNFGEEAEFNPERFFVGKRYFNTFPNPTKEVRCECKKDFTPTLEMVLDSDFWEMIGFGLCDGTWMEYNIQIFPHWKKDKEVRDKFVNILNKYNIHNKVRLANKKRQRSDGEFGYPYLYIYDKSFVDWLIELGFNYTGNKRIPLSVFNLPKECRCAFIRGMFSADGHKEKNKGGYSVPTTFCVDENLRQDIIRLCLSVGCEVVDNLPRKKEYRDCRAEIRVQNVDFFVKNIGYMQDYKNEGIYRTDRSKYRWDLLPKGIVPSLIKDLKGEKSSVLKYRVKRGDRISRGKVIEAYIENGLPIPDILKYRFVKFSKSWKDKEEQLYDIEVFNDEHIFLGNFIAVHNCKGSSPKGIINVKNPNISQSSLDEFRQAWQQTMVGTRNSHRTPIINGLDLQWLDLSKNTNRDMEFSDWLKFLLVMACAVYRIDPSELGFQFKDQTNIFGQAGQKERLQHSKDKGLKPILVFLQEVINYYLVSELDEDFEFVFTGVDAEDEGRQVEIDAKKIQNGMVCLEDIFEKYSGRKFNPETDTILNQSYQLQKQMQMQQSMYGGEAMNEEVDRQIASEEKEDTQKSFSSNPIMDAAMSYIEKNWGEK